MRSTRLPVEGVASANGVAAEVGSTLRVAETSVGAAEGDTIGATLACGRAPNWKGRAVHPVSKSRHPSVTGRIMRLFIAKRMKSERHRMAEQLHQQLHRLLHIRVVHHLGGRMYVAAGDGEAARRNAGAG